MAAEPVGVVPLGNQDMRGPPHQKVVVLNDPNQHTWVVPADCAHIDEIHMCGGGQAGFDGTENGQNGGAGGIGGWYANKITYNNPLVIATGTSLNIQIGAGGASNGALGGTTNMFAADGVTKLAQAPGGGVTVVLPSGDNHFKGGNAGVAFNIFDNPFLKPVGIANWPYVLNDKIPFAVNPNIFFQPALFPPLVNPARLDWWWVRQGYVLVPILGYVAPNGPLFLTPSAPAGSGGGGCAGNIVGGISGISYFVPMVNLGGDTQSGGDPGGGDPGDLSLPNIIAKGIALGVTTGNAGLGGGAGDSGGGRGGSIETMQNGTRHVSSPAGFNIPGNIVYASDGGDGGYFTTNPNETYQDGRPLGYGGSLSYGSPDGFGNGGGGASSSPVIAYTTSDVSPIPGGSGGNGFRWTDNSGGANNGVSIGPGGGGAGGNGGNNFDVTRWQRYIDPAFTGYAVGSNGGNGGTGAGGGGGGCWSSLAPSQYHGHGGAGGDGFIVVIYTVTQPGAIHFDGTAYLTLASLTATNSPLFSMSLWFKSIDFPAAPQIFAVGYDDTYDPWCGSLDQGDEKIVVELAPAFGTPGMQISTNNLPTDTNWHHMLVSMDATAGFFKIYIDDVDVSSLNFNDGGVTGEWNGRDIAIGSNPTIPNNLIGSLYNLWIFPSVSLLDGSGNIPVLTRRKFYSATGKAVNLGATGQLPTGTPPPIFFTGPAASFTNKGTGGTFVQTGVLTDVAPPPLA